MSLQDIIRQIDSEISKLQQIRKILQGPTGSSVQAKAAKPTGRRGPRKLSKEARDRIAAAQRARWARVKAGQKKK